MAYQLAFSLSLGPGQTGLTLAAQLLDESGSDVGSEVATGFTEIGLGFYLWNYASIPDGHRGAVKFYEDGSPASPLLVVSINPEEAERLDADISSVGGVGAGAVSHTVTVQVGGSPIDNAKVWITSDSGGTDTGTVVAGTLLTDADGQVTFNLDASTTYWQHIEKAGYNFTAQSFTTGSS